MLSSPGSPSGPQAALVAPPAPRADASQAAWQVLESANSVQEAAQSWLDLVCTHVSRCTGGVLVFGEPDLGPFVPLANWPQGQGPSALLADAANEAFEARAASLLETGTHTALALPLLIEGRLHGLVAVELAGRADASATLAVLRWALARLEALVLQDAAAVREGALSRVTTALNLLGSTLAEQGFSASAHALATDLALHLQCDRVSVGFVRKGSAEVVAVSHSAQFGERMNLIRAIGLAMDESLDQRSTVVFPARPDEVMVTRDHAALSRQHGCGAILSVPFVIEQEEADEVKGAFTFERAAHQPFEAHEIELAQGAVALASRVLQARRHSERPTWQRITEGLRLQYVKVLGPRHFKRKLVALLSVSAIAFFSVVQGSYQVRTNATLEGAVRRVVVAPYDGYIASAPHRAGDQVKAGAVLAAMDQSDLKLEELRVAGQVQQHAQQAQGALAEHERAQGGISMAQAEQAQAQLALLADQIQRADILAPFDGIVVSGDLTQQLGGAVKRGQVLFEVSPLNAYRVVLEVDESEINAVRMGQTGRLVLVALPGREWPLRVTRITPVTVSHEGRTFFRVEAALQQMGPDLRPGMEGVGKLDAGQRHLFWIWTHRFFDWLRVWTWSWL